MIEHCRKKAANTIYFGKVAQHIGTYKVAHHVLPLLMMVYFCIVAFQLGARIGKYTYANLTKFLYRIIIIFILTIAPVSDASF